MYHITLNKTLNYCIYYNSVYNLLIRTLENKDTCIIHILAPNVALLLYTDLATLISKTFMSGPKVCIIHIYHI